MIGFFARRQRDAILKALGLEQQVQQNKYADQIISSAMEFLKSKLANEKRRVSLVFDHADHLVSIVDTKFKELATTLDSQLRALTPAQAKQKFHARANSGSNTAPQRHYFQKQIIETANHFDYFANLEKYRSWVRVTLMTEQEFDYVVSFHGYGAGDVGILAASAFTYLKVPNEDGGMEPLNLQPATTELFQFNYVETKESFQKRFAEWLESSLAIALAEWKRSLQA